MTRHEIGTIDELTIALRKGVGWKCNEEGDTLLITEANELMLDAAAAIESLKS